MVETKECPECGEIHVFDEGSEGGACNCGYRLNGNESIDFVENFDFGKHEMKESTDDEDRRRGIDGWCGDIGIAMRKRRISIKRYGQITIRYRINESPGRTEYEKMVAGEAEADIYIFEFTDAMVICFVSDIVDYLRNNAVDKTKLFRNPDGNEGLGIDIKDIPHIIKYI